MNKAGLFLIISILCFNHQVFGKEILQIDNKTINQEEMKITPFLYWLNGADTILFSESTGLINQEHRFVFYVKNNTNLPLSKIVHFEERYQNVNKIKIHSFLTDSIQIIHGFHNSIALDLLPYETKLIAFSVRELNRDDPQHLPIALVSSDFMESSIHKMYTRQSFFLGLFAFISLFNLIMYFVTGWTTYIKYALFVFSALLYFFYYFGIIQDVFPWVKSISYNLVRIWYSLIFISYFYFVNDFGGYKTRVPKAYQLLNFGIKFKLIESVLNTLLHFTGWQFIYSPLYKYTILGFEVILMGLIVFYILKNKNIRGRIIIIAALLMIFGGIIDQLFIFNDFENFYFMEIAVVMELLTFSVGLGYITKIFYQEKRENQLLYIEQLKENEKIQIELAQQLEEKVRLRTIDLEKEKGVVEVKNKENELLLGEIHHRVKNNLQVISSLLSLQERNITDKTAKAAILEGKERVQSMGLIHKMLYQQNNFSGINMSEYIEKLTLGLLDSFGKNSDDFELNFDIKDISLDVDTAIPLGLIINELVVNALKHAYTVTTNPKINIQLQEINSQLVLRVEDNGVGDVSDVKSSQSFGMKLVNSLSRQLSGTIDMEQRDGLCFKIAIDDYKLIA